MFSNQMKGSDVADNAMILLDDPDAIRRQIEVGAAADYYAREGAFEDYRGRRARNTLRRQLDDLTTFVEFLEFAWQFYPKCKGTHAEVRTERRKRADMLQHQPEKWEQITGGLVEGFKRWLLREAYAVGSVNLKLSTIKRYAELAFEAGALTSDQYARIRIVKGFSFRELHHVNETRAGEGTATRRGCKKAESVSLTGEQVRALKTHPGTPQGRRDGLMMCLLLEHGLRVGELAGLDVTAINLLEGTFTFYRPKVSKVQTHKLTSASLRAARAWFASGDAPAAGKLLRCSQIGGELTKAGMSERAITQRVHDLGVAVGVDGLSAHDLRHSWATRAARNQTDAFDLRDAGGWSSLAMPSRYVEDAKIANEGVKLGED